MAKQDHSLALKNTLAEAELIKNFRHDNSWLSTLTPKPQWVNNDVIKIPKRGLAPKVLINNKIYPIASNKREDGFISLSLNMYDTENTTVTDEELYALPYDKLGDVQQQHREELEDKTAEHALYSIAPDHSDKTPVLVTTGEDDGTGRKRLTAKDLINFKKALDKRLVPKDGRVLVLCPDHVADLLVEDLTFKQRYQDANGGMIAKSYYGFETYESTYAPKYDKSAKTKKPFGSADDGVEASVVFNKKNTVKAPGSVKRYARAAADNPEMRENTIGFRLYWIAVAIKDEGTAAIISG
ncbi:hypothetical protein LEQ04_08495 [Riemerella anatipestifer]|uniref:hypothetical protein n=1 Tax=Riemerella anatipestifer TaxID=34085 RepID=UPI00129E743F|nr:hypothetical protein [Riemerella anatipestifer]MRM84518.1 hypothetical protein [Riemerella anatipestifer]WPC10745.1 hypothetical protein LEQ05_12895 [Riemerella anatipestifer]WPC13605.1 hypothetical protein LEQ03_02770 [Riemerella anatipestifer]WPC14618.1 hypothetical protein LEQ04_08495 [Riemerella anatipestifer]